MHECALIILFYFIRKYMNSFVTLEDRILCDLEMILNGGFAPLSGFLNESDYNSVVENCRLCNGSVWTIPIVLPVSDTDNEKLKNEIVITLKDKTGLPIAKLLIESNGSILTTHKGKMCLNYVISSLLI